MSPTTTSFLVTAALVNAFAVIAATSNDGMDVTMTSRTIAGWSGWKNIGGFCSSTPSMASWGFNRFDVFVRGENSAMYQRVSELGKFRDWERVGGGLASAPGSVGKKGKGLVTAVLGHDNNVYTNIWLGKWEGWVRVPGGRFNSAPAVLWTPSQIDIFVKGFDNKLKHITKKDGKWGRWRNRGWYLTSAPSAVSRKDGHFDIVVKGRRNEIFLRSFTGKWGKWENLGGITSSAPVISSWGPDRLDVFARGTDNALWTRSFSEGTWTTWVSLDGIILSGAGAVSTESGRIDVAVCGTTNNVYLNSYRV